MRTKTALPEPPVKNFPAISVDDASRIVQISASGFLTASELRVHFGNLARVIGQVRGRQWPVRILLDLRDGIVHSPDGIEVIQRENARLYKAGDRIAIVQGSALLSMQVKRVDPEFHKSFSSVGEAMEWLATG